MLHVCVALPQDSEQSLCQRSSFRKHNDALRNQWKRPTAEQVSEAG